VLTPAEHLASPEPGIERRFYRRVAPSGLITVAFADGNVGMLLNLSENGFLVSTPLALPQNFVCRVSLLLNGLANAIDVYARVVWTAKSHRAGIQFLDLSEHDRERVRKWAEVEERPDPNEQNEEPQPEDGGQATTGNKKTPPNLKFPRTQRLAGVMAGLAMIAMAVALSSKSSEPGLPSAVPFSFKNVLAMQPGGVAWAEPLDTRTSTVAPPARSDAAAHVVSPGSVTVPPVPSAVNENSAASNSAAANASRRTDAPTQKFAPVNSKAATTVPKIATQPSSNTHNGTKTRVRNSAVLAAQNHFGNKYIGHLDLADSDSGTDDSAASVTVTGATAPANAAVSAMSAKEPPTNSAPPSGATPGSAHAPAQSSAIAGSIMGKGSPAADEEDVPANLALLNSAAANSVPTNPTSLSFQPRAANPAPVAPRSAVSALPAPPSSAPAPASAMNSGSSAPANVANTNAGPAVHGSSVSAANSTSIAAAAPPNRFWQVTLPRNGRASFINLPGEQVLQSAAVTLHIQRSVLAPAAAPAATAASTANASRTETVHIGELLSHVEPWTPRLTQETGARVSVRAYLGADGRVERLVPVNGSVALVSSAARAVREWRFAPTLLDGKPVQTAAYVVVEFHPQNDGSAQP
jgi:PilZ domain/Gram-negative bacterial TonB protein C-terminal